MVAERLSILYLTPLPPSPPGSGAQARMHGLLTSLAARHEITAVSLIDPDLDPGPCERALREHCREVVLLPCDTGLRDKRRLQLRSLLSSHSFERHRFAARALQETLDRLQRSRRFDLVNLEFPYLGHLDLRKAPGGALRPALVVDSHEIAYDLGRQMASGKARWPRRIYGGLNWRKLRAEELATYRAADGIYTCSAADEQRLLAEVPAARTAVIPNAADVDFYRPAPSHPPADGRTVLFFGLLSTYPNADGAQFLLREIWPRVLARRPEARLKIVGADPPGWLGALAGPGVEVTGFVEDLRPHLAAAALVAVPLRLGGGTRLKIVEGMAMGKAIVSTALGAEGIDAVPGRDLLLADDPEAFADAVARLLVDPELARTLGERARRLAVERYSWSAAAEALDRFLREIVSEGRSASPSPREAALPSPRAAPGPEGES